MILTPDMFAGTTTFVLGSEKHAGKTTLLNYLIRRLRGDGALAYLSVGVDGSGTDSISGAAKPHVVAQAGDWLVTAQSALQRSDLDAEIHEVFPFSTVLGRPALVRVVRGGPVELIGPGTNTQLAAVLDSLSGQAGIKTVLVDGAINRITQVAASAIGAYVYVIRVDRANIARAIDTMRLMHRLQDIAPAGSGEESGEGVAVIDGALTPARVRSIPAGCRTVVVENFSHVFLTHAELKSLLGRAELRFKLQMNFRAFVVNLYDVTRPEFLDMLGDDAIAAKVAFNPYQEAA